MTEVSGLPHRHAAKDLLYVTHRVPYPPDKGDRIRTYYTLRHLAQRHRVHLACLADEPVTKTTRDELEGLCHRVAIIPNQSRLRWVRAGWAILTGGVASIGAFHSAELSRLLESWARETRFDLALASASSTAPYLRLPALLNVPAVVDLVDVDSQKWLDYAAATRGLKRWVYRREAAALRAYEREIARWSRAILLVSEAEAQLFSGIAPYATVRTVTNGVNLDYFRPSTKEVPTPSCVFVGAMDYRPNVDAVCWFAAEVWPRVREALPQAVFRIVGRNPAPAVLALTGTPGIEVIGPVPDVRPAVDASAVVVAPLRIARGLQNKVLEALAMAKSTLVSPPALAGFPASPSLPVVTVQTRDEWVGALLRLFDDPVERSSLGQAARRYVEQHYHWDRCLEPLQDVIEQAIQNHRQQSQT